MALDKNAFGDDFNLWVLSYLNLSPLDYEVFLCGVMGEYISQESFEQAKGELRDYSDIGEVASNLQGLVEDVRLPEGHLFVGVGRKDQTGKCIYAVVPKKQSLTINKTAKEIYDWVESFGWHNKTPLECLALIASEVGEAVNECRDVNPTYKLGDELADIVIRTLDFAHEQGIDMEAAIAAKMEINKARKKKPAGRLK
jgi:NTP pyrophosphatase (non-canonical NTP hydrolase)